MMLVTLLGLFLASVVGINSAQERPTLTTEQLERLTIRPIPGIEKSENIDLKTLRNSLGRFTPSPNLFPSTYSIP